MSLLPLVMATETNLPGQLLSGKTPKKSPAYNEIEKMKFNDKKAADEFIKAYNIRNSVLVSIEVLNHLYGEKQSEIKLIEKRLGNNFGMDTNKTYYYDENARVIYEMVERPNANKSGKKLEKEMFHIFKTDKDLKLFVELASAKKTAGELSNAIILLAREKGIELKKANDDLDAQYGIKTNAMYRFDPDRQILYQVNKK